MKIKSAVIFGYCLFLSFYSYGQNDEKINNEIGVLFTTIQTLLDNDNCEEAILVLKKIDSLCLLVQNHDYYLYSCIYRISCYHDLLEYGEMKDLLDKAKLYSEKYPIKSKGIGIELSYMYASYFFDQGNIDIAENYYNEVYKSIQGGNKFSFREDDVYNNLGIVHLRRGDSKLAINYFKKAILEDKNRENFTSVRARWEKNIAEGYMNLGNYELSYEYFQKSKSIIEGYKLNKTTRRYYTDIYEHFGEFFHTTGEYDSAHYYLDLALEYEPEEDVLINYNHHKGVTYLKEQRFDKAKEFLEIAKKNSIEFYSERHEYLSNTYHTIGSVYSQQKNYRSALEYFQKAVIASTLDFNNTNPKVNPRSNRIISQQSLLKSLEAKAKVFALLENYKAALESYNAAQSLIEEMLKKYIISSESRFFLVNKSKSLYESAIKTALKNDDLASAFSFSQKSHGLLLWQNYQVNQATQNSGIPDSFLRKEQQLKIEISESERKLYQAHQNQEEDKIKAQEEILFDLNYNYQNLLESFEENYSKYYELKYLQLKAPSVSTIQSDLLDTNTAFIEYFLGKDQLYAFVITNREIKVFQKEIPTNFNQLIETFRENISEPNQTRFNPYCNSAIALYELLLADCLKEIQQEKNIIVIPDEELNYIPFAALIPDIPEEATKNNRYDLLPFLVYDYNFSYNYSSALFLKQKYLNKQDDLLVSYAPSFDRDSTHEEDLETLLHNVDEVLLINKVVGGQIYTDSTATLDQFKEDISRYKIVHLATHASCNDSIPADSKIHFYDQPLYANEIYNLPHQIEMAVLSACETGTGKIRKGEGIISMARAFISSGCPSVITSLWKVKDEQTSQIMTQFYAHLKLGKKKNVALNQAKRDYLQEAPAASFSHPYYWATFVPIGNIESIVQENHSYGLWGLMFLVLVLALFWWFKKKKR